MKVLYYSKLPFSDCNYPLIRECQKQGALCKYIVFII